MEKEAEPPSAGRLNRILEDMIEQYTSWPFDLVNSYRRAGAISHSLPFNGGLLVGCGMGGSGFAIDASKYMLEDYGYQVIVNKSHVPPPYVGPGTPVLAVSYSGSTMETIECARRAIERGALVCGVAGEGSRLHRLLEGHGFPVVPIKARGLPRTSLGLLVGSILGLLLPFEEALARVELVSRTLRAEWTLELSRRVASAIVDGAVPVIIACGSFAPLAWRWRSELAENAKLHALVEVYPEAGHNAINAWEHTSGRGRYVFIVLKANVDDEVCAHIEDWVEETYNRVGETVPVDLRDFARVHPLAAVFAGSMVAGITSSILAVNRGKDPSAIPGIQRYKNALRAFRGEGVLG